MSQRAWTGETTNNAGVKHRAAEVREAARLARIDEFIKRLSGGYDTMVGERGFYDAPGCGREIRAGAAG